MPGMPGKRGRSGQSAVYYSRSVQKKRGRLRANSVIMPGGRPRTEADLFLLLRCEMGAGDFLIMQLK